MYPTTHKFTEPRTVFQRGQWHPTPACVQDLMFIPRGDRDLGLAYQTHPGNQASSRGEAKNSAVLL